MPDERWVLPKYSKKKIIKAGKIINSLPPESDEYKEAVEIINNWREAHAYPMQIIYTHLSRMREKDSITVASRLKRMKSIRRKLEREPEMQLWRVQDLGGCRFIVDSVDEVYYYVDKLKQSRVRHLFIRDRDYINYPKASGYRSYHVILQYQSDKQSKEKYNRNMLIEVQFRTRLQHIWATAVETMGNLMQEELKSSIGDEDVQRFFLLVSSYFAILEDCNTAPNTPSNLEGIKEEINRINSEKHILERLNAYRLTLDSDERLLKDKKRRNKKNYYLLDLNYGESDGKPFLSITSFDNPSEASERYAEVEAEKGNTGDVVLVQSETFSELKRAYPNYYGDIAIFVRKVQSFIDSELKQ